MGRRPKQSNGKPVATEDDRALCLTEYIELRAAAARTAQATSAMFKRFEALGVDKATIKRMYDLSQMDRGEATALLKREADYAQVLDLVVVEADGQSTFATALIPAKPSPLVSDRLRTARAFGDGYNTGKAGGKIEACPFNHMPGSVEFVAWRDGHGDGMADRLALHPERANVTAANDKPRGRRRGAAAAPSEAPENSDSSVH